MGMVEMEKVLLLVVTLQYSSGMTILVQGSVSVCVTAFLWL